MRQPLFSRDQWRERGRVVIAPNEEAKDVINFFIPNKFGVAGARHVFSENQTVPMEQLLPQSEAA